MKLERIVTLVLLIFSLHAFASESESFLVHLKARNRDQRSLVANYIHIDSIQGEDLYAIVNKTSLKALRKHASQLLFEVRLLNGESVTSLNDLPPVIREVQFPSGDEAYHTYDEMVAELLALQTEFPDLAQVISIGQSLEGKEISGIRITDPKNLDMEANVSGIFYVGAHHAREHLSTEIPLLYARHLLESYATNDEIKELITNRDIYIVPMLNPDGAMFDISGPRYKWWRKNRRSNDDGSYGVDLNRNYGYRWGTGGSSSAPGSEVYMGPTPFSEPETQAVRDFVQANDRIRMVLSLHTFSELILYPWGGMDDAVGGRDQAVFEAMAQKMAEWNGYTPMQASELYIASGDTCDWVYGELGKFCFTFELSPNSMWGGGFYPGASIIDTVFEANLQPLLYLLGMAENPYSAIEAAR